MGRSRENSKRPNRLLHERVGKRDGKHFGSGYMIFFDKFKRYKGKELNMTPGFGSRTRWYH